MFTFISKLQQKPERQRRAIAWWTALTVTLCIFVLWAVSFVVRLDATTRQEQVESVSPLKSLSEITSSFSSIFEGLF